MTRLTTFRAINTTGLFVPDAADVTALSLIFEKVYLPRNLEIIKGFAGRYRIKTGSNYSPPRLLAAEENTSDDPFDGMPSWHRDNALTFLAAGQSFAIRNHELFGPVFETDAFEEGDPFEVTLVEERHGGPNLYRVATRPLQVTLDEETFPEMIGKGYLPVLTHSLGVPATIADATSALSVAALLAMQAVKIVLPRTKSAAPADILEARDRLRDHLPPFWSAMLKLTNQLRDRIEHAQSAAEIGAETRDMVDTIVRPAVIDLEHKLVRERKQWAYRILSPIQKGLRLLVGNPPVTQQQLITSALVLGSDVVMSAAENMRTIEALKQEAGLTFLLETQRAFEGNDAG
jgi:hypothetical protein